MKAHLRMTLQPDFEYNHQTTIFVQSSVSISEPVVSAKQRWRDSSDVCHQAGLPDSRASYLWPGRRQSDVRMGFVVQNYKTFTLSYVVASSIVL